MKRIFLIAFLLPLISIGQTKTTTKKKTTKSKTAAIVSTVSKTVTSTVNTSNTVDISAGLKEALNKGITEQVSKLAVADGFYKNESLKILFPTELEFVDKTLRKYGMSSLAEEGIKTMNHAAENAVKEATPIFIDAIKNMSINDAKTILLGNENAATVYLQSATTQSLSAKLQPIIKQSMSTTGADLIWNSIISKYNSIPLMGKVNPDITSYVTDQTLQGVFKMIAVEEKKIRTDASSRTTQLLQQVFALAPSK